MGIIRGICTSDIRGIQKSEVQEADIEVDWGIVGDAHGGKWHRQISLLSLERIREFREARGGCGIWRIRRKYYRGRVRF